MTNDEQARRDAVAVAMMESDNNILEVVALSKAEGFKYSVKSGDEYFINTKILSAAVQQGTPLVVMQIASMQDFHGMLLAMAESVEAAKVFADAE